MGAAKYDEFKWFGEGFDGFPRRPLEDTVEYVIYVLRPKSDLREYLQQIEKAAIRFLNSVAKDYIWQREKFNLQLVRQDGKPLAAKSVVSSGATELPPYLVLRGKTNYGDSIADEWLIVYILRELSKTFADAWIRVYDSDGEFLLIEAANALPRWLKPEVAENRVSY